MGNFSLSVKNVNKQFVGVQALKDVSFTAYGGEALALLGINGAGKSTMMNILAGEIKMDSGSIHINEEEIRINNQKDAAKNGISLIHQEAVVFKDLSVAENMFINQLDRYMKNGVINYPKMFETANEYLGKLGVAINPKTLVQDITIGDRQLLEIARALSQNSKIILFDEPTSSLTIEEKKRLFEIINQLKQENKIIIYITHFLDEVLEICERAVVMMDGAVTGNTKTEEATIDDFVKMMVGNSIETVVNGERTISDTPILKVKNLTRVPMVNDVNFTVNQGEILGIWGLLGSGRTEIIRAMLNLDKPRKGVVEFRGQDGKMREMRGRKLLQNVGYVTEDRHVDGLFFHMPIWKNITLPDLKKFGSFILDEKKEREAAKKQIAALEIKTPDEDVPVDKLSGGNQQKVIMARWINKQPNLFILDEPTRGVDVNAKNAIHKLIKEFSEQGGSVILISSEIEEILNLSDRVLIVKDGTFVSEVAKRQMTKQVLMEQSLC